LKISRFYTLKESGITCYFVYSNIPVYIFLQDNRLKEVKWLVCSTVWYELQQNVQSAYPTAEHKDSSANLLTIWLH